MEVLDVDGCDGETSVPFVEDVAYFPNGQTDWIIIPISYTMLKNSLGEDLDLVKYYLKLVHMMGTI